MSLSASDLFLSRAAVPGADAIVRQVASHGYSIAFPAGFSVADGQSDWVPVTVNGALSGFDFGIFPRASYAADDSEAPAVPDFGDTVLAFAARHNQTSLLAMALVQRAICELSDAQGWWHEGEEQLGNAQMIAFCTATIAAIGANPEPAPAARPRFDRDYFRTVGRSLVWGAALMGAAAFLIFLMGYFFAPGAQQ